MDMLKNKEKKTHNTGIYKWWKTEFILKFSGLWIKSL